jgi:hypothetical protein
MEVAGGVRGNRLGNAREHRRMGAVWYWDDWKGSQYGSRGGKGGGIKEGDKRSRDERGQRRRENQDERAKGKRDRDGVIGT